MEIPVVRSEVNFIVFAGNLEDSSSSAVGNPEEDAHREHSAENEQESLHHIHPDDSFHSAQIGEQDDDDADEYNNVGDIQARKGGHGHTHQVEDGSHLGKMLQDEGQRTVVTCHGSKPAFKILIGGEPDDASEQRHDEPNHSDENDGHHQSLHQQNPVAGIGSARIGQEGDA